MSRRFHLSVAVFVTLLTACASAESDADSADSNFTKAPGAIVPPPKSETMKQLERVKSAYDSDNDESHLTQPNAADTPMKFWIQNWSKEVPQDKVTLFKWHAELKEPAETIDLWIVEESRLVVPGLTRSQLFFFRDPKEVPIATATCSDTGSNTSCKDWLPGMPIKVGECIDSTVLRTGGRFGDVPDENGSSVVFWNRGGLISSVFEKEVAASKLGDPVEICLLSVPDNCPPGDNRGKSYSVRNKRTAGKWSLPDSSHMCGGA